MMVIHLLALNHIFTFFITTIPLMVYYYSPVVLRSVLLFAETEHQKKTPIRRMSLETLSYNVVSSTPHHARGSNKQL
jgi:hypothetical protein